MYLNIVEPVDVTTEVTTLKEEVKSLKDNLAAEQKNHEAGVTILKDEVKSLKNNLNFAKENHKTSLSQPQDTFRRQLFTEKKVKAALMNKLYVERKVKCAFKNKLCSERRKFKYELSAKNTELSVANHKLRSWSIHFPYQMFWQKAWEQHVQQCQNNE